MSKLLEIITTTFLICLFIIAISGTIQAHTSVKTIERDAPTLLDQVVELKQPVIEVPDQTVPEVRLSTFEDPFAPDPRLKDLTEEDWYLIESISLAEAMNQGVEGVALVQWVVINRHIKTGASIRSIVYAPRQFYTAGMNGTNELSREARELIESGWDESQGAIYFRTGHYHGFGTPLFSYKDHFFSK